MKKISEFKKLRLTNGMTQEEVAQHWGVSQQYVSKIESNLNLSEDKEKEIIEILKGIIENGGDE